MTVDRSGRVFWRDWGHAAQSSDHGFDGWRGALDWRSDAVDGRVRRDMAPAAGLWLDDVRPWELFWTQTFRPRASALYGMSLEFVQARLRGLLDQTAREVVGLSRGAVRRGAVHGWVSWELHKSGAWHAHLLVIGLGREHWRALKEFAYERDGIARIYPVANRDALRMEALYVAKYVAKENGRAGGCSFDVFGNWRTSRPDAQGILPLSETADAVECGERRP